MNQKQLKIIDLLCLDETPESLKSRLKFAISGEETKMENITQWIPARLQNKTHNKKILNHLNWVVVEEKTNSATASITLEYQNYPGLLIKVFSVYFFENKRISFRIILTLNKREEWERKKRTFHVALVRSNE